jgi:hypothetical protein
MRLGITDKGFKRLSRRFGSSLLSDLLAVVGPHVYWRIQPQGAEIKDYHSMGYSSDDNMPDEIEGVWAFANLENALVDMYEPGSGYAGTVESGGESAELVAIKAFSEEDGPDASVIVHSGDIIGRFDARAVIEDQGVRNYLIKEGWIADEDEE